MIIITEGAKTFIDTSLVQLPHDYWKNHDVADCVENEEKKLTSN